MKPRWFLFSRATWLCLVVTAGGCAASHIPIQISDPMPDSPSLKQVESAREQFQDRPVRWGGAIVQIEQRSDGLLVEVEGRPLEAYGRPSAAAGDSQRFLVRIPGVLANAGYQVGRPITVFGRLSGSAPALAEPSESLPLVQSETAQLWQRYHDPFYVGYPDDYYYPRPYGYGYGFGLGYRHFGYPYFRPYGFRYGPYYHPHWWR